MGKNIWLVWLLVIFFAGTVVVEAGSVGKKAAAPQSIRLAADVVLTSWGTITLGNIDLYPASFRIEALGKVIYIDPAETDGIEPADLIFITHAHADHMSLPDLEKLVKKETLIIAPHHVAVQLAGYKVKEVRPGDKFDVGKIRCEAVYAYNKQWGSAHPRTANNVGYVLTINGMRIYHMGDTDFIPEMKSLKNINVALVPVGVGKFAMNSVQAAEAVDFIRPAIAIPMHYDAGGNEPELFRNMIGKGHQSGHIAYRYVSASLFKR